MNIHFNLTGKNPSADKVTTAYGSTSRGPAKAVDGACTMDISGIVMDNNAYTGHGKTAEDVMQDMGNRDLTWERNYMTVMSNSMSDEDFARLQEEGFHPGSTEIDTVVTIVDKIKAALAEGGTEVVGYTDTLDLNTLTKITGSRGRAAELAKQFEQADVPMTEENLTAVMSAVSEGSCLQEPSEGAAKYLIENKMEPTIENLYLAEHAGAVDATRQARGYYDAGANGYLAKKADQFDWNGLAPQIQRVLTQAGFEATDVQAMEDAKWLLQNGMELTCENLLRLTKIQDITLPIGEEKLFQSAIAALADGKKAGEAIPGQTRSLTHQAAALVEAVQELDEQTADIAAVQNEQLTLMSYFRAKEQLTGKDGQKATSNGSLESCIRARRLLEEVRLGMTTEANRQLLKSGFSIDTAPMEELIAKLKEAEDQLAQKLFAENDGAKAEEKKTVYSQTLQAMSYLSGAPAAVIGAASSSFSEMTLSDLERQARVMQTAYEKAGASYETLQTAPRADLGDSIRKAFRNVDDILKDMQFETTEENRRAVRILGYNRMEISKENIELVRETDASIQKLLKKMTPASVLKMIREGENPLAVSLQELSEYMDSQSGSPEQEAEKYSKFLYKLEQNKEISAQERESYIGIYRMMRTLEKDDGAAIGSILSQGAELNFQNLLSAVRSRKKGGLDYRVDDTFGGVEEKKSGARISEQIEAAYHTAQALVDDVLEEQNDAEQSWQQEQANTMREAAKVADDVLQTLLEYDMPVTADNLYAAQAYLQEQGSTWKAIYDRASHAGKGRLRAGEESLHGGTEALLDEKTEQLIDSFTSKEEVVKSYAELAETATDVLQEALETAMQEKIEGTDERPSALDVRQLSLLHKQLSFSVHMAEQEEYEIPVSVNGEMTSIHLSIRQAASEEQAGHVVIRCQTDSLGSVAGEFAVREEEHQVEGYIACEKDLAEQYFTGLKEVFLGLLQDNGLIKSDVQVFGNTTIQKSLFERKQTAEKTKDGHTTDKGALEKSASNSTLYQTAKQFLTAIRTIERR